MRYAKYIQNAAQKALSVLNGGGPSGESRHYAEKTRGMGMGGRQAGLRRRKSSPMNDYGRITLNIYLSFFTFYTHVPYVTFSTKLNPNLQ